MDKIEFIDDDGKVRFIMEDDIKKVEDNKPCQKRRKSKKQKQSEKKQ